MDKKKPEPTHKTCKKCDQVRKIELFYLSGGAYRRPVCSLCMSAENKEKYRERAKAYSE
jgi:hypothetical protein